MKRFVMGREDFEALVAGDVVHLGDGAELILNDIGFAGMRKAVARAEAFVELVEETRPSGRRERAAEGDGVPGGERAGRWGRMTSAAPTEAPCRFANGHCWHDDPSYIGPDIPPMSEWPDGVIYHRRPGEACCLCDAVRPVPGWHVRSEDRWPEGRS